MSNASLANSRSSAHSSSHRRVARRFHSPTVAIELLESRLLLTNFNIHGQVLWTDGAGGTHPAPLVDIQFYELDGTIALGGVDQIGGTFQTDLAGNYSINFTNVTDEGSNPDIFVRVFARSKAANVQFSETNLTTYSIDSAVLNEIAEGASLTLNVTAGNTGVANQAFSVNHAVLVFSQYTGAVTGTSPSQVNVSFNSTNTGSFFRTSTKTLVIRGTAGFQWDEIQHEFGHYIQNLYGIENNPGGRHSFQQNLSTRPGSNMDIGTRLSWGEGWPTFFAIAAQVQSSAAALNIPQVGDTAYTATFPFVSIANPGGTINNNLESTLGVGQDDEVSVANVLWDLYDSSNESLDDDSYGDVLLFKILNRSQAKTLGAAWNELAASLTDSGKARIGGIFEQNNVSPTLTGPADHSEMSSTIPTFSWNANLLNDFKIKFYNSDFTKVLFEKTLGNVTSYKPTSAEWGTIRGGDGVVKWVVEGRNTSSPATPGGSIQYYWSGARTLGSAGLVFVIDDTGSVAEEIAGVQLAYSKYLDDLSKRGVSPPMMQVVTFKDDVTVHITSRDLAAVKNVINSLVASGGGDCPEASAEALAVAAKSVATGGTIMLATDASTQPGTDMTGLIQKLRAKGVTVNVVLSGDCGTIGSSSSSVASLSSAGLPGGGSEEDECNGDDCGCHDDADHATVPQAAGWIRNTSSVAGPVVYAPGIDGHDDDVDEPQVTDPGQPAIDEHGNKFQTATKLLLNAHPVLGAVGAEDDPEDYFSIELEAGKVYTVLIDSDDPTAAFAASLPLFDRDGLTQLQTGSIPGAMKVKPTVSGKYYLDVLSFTRVAYTIEVTDDPLAGVTSAVELFSAVAAATGGVFLVHDEVNSGSPEAYTAALFNVLTSTLGPAIISANPGAAPQGQTVSVTLTGSGTNWRSGVTTLSFNDPGIVVKSLAVLNANTLTAELQINASVAQDFYDATVVSNLGGGKTETSVGVDVLQITAAVTAPTLLGVDPANLSKGTGGSVVIRGANVHWTASSVVDLGPGVVVKAVHFVNATQLKVDYEVNASADTGFRTAIVTQGAEVVQRERAFFVGVKNLAIASLTGIDTPNGKTGATLAVKITGENTHFEAGKTTASLGDGIDIVSVVVNSATEIVVNLKIRNDAALGFRNVTVTTDGETAALLSGFFVEAGVPGGNHAPVLNPNGNPNQSNIHEDIPLASNLGNHIATLISRMTPGGGITDPDAGALKGVAVIGANQMYGTWQFTTDNGTTWKEFGNTSSANALFLASNNATRVRFVPKTNYAGTVGFTFVAWDQTSGENGKTGSALVRGGASSLSVDKDHSFITVNPINDAPVLNPKGEPTITRKTGDSPSVSQNGTPVAQIIQRMGPSGNITDVDPNALPGIAVIGANQMGGTWEYTKNGGGTWVPFGETSNAAALLLAADAQTRVRFLPGPNFSGQTGFTFLGWDRTTGVNGTKVNAQTRGGTTAFSIDKENCLLTDGGNVQAITAGGILALRGDGFANDVTIVVNDNGTMTLTPNRGTQINGQDGPLTVVASLLGSALMGDGADKLRVLSERAVELAKDSVVDMGSGDDLLHVQRVVANKRAQVRLGAGRDRLELLDTVFSSLVSTDFNAEDTIVTL